MAECQCVDSEVGRIVGGCSIHGRHETRWIEDGSDGLPTMKRLTAEGRQEAMDTLCPGYGNAACTRNVEYLQWVLNDPRCFCEEHAKEACAFWHEEGFPGGGYLKLADGTFVTWMPEQSPPH